MNHSFEPSAPDRVLVDVIRRDGSEEAFSLLYDRHTPRAYQTAWRIFGGSRHHAEDAVQEAWVRAIASLDSWRTESEFGPWFRSITAHVAIDALRKDRRFVEASGSEVVVAEEPFGDRLDLEAALAAIAPGYRAVLVLHDVEGFTHEEIGTQLGITAGTSKGQLYKARRAVRALLSPAIRRESANAK